MSRLYQEFISRVPQHLRLAVEAHPDYWMSLLETGEPYPSDVISEIQQKAEARYIGRKVKVQSVESPDSWAGGMLIPGGKSPKYKGCVRQVKWKNGRLLATILTDKGRFRTTKEAYILAPGEELVEFEVLGDEAPYRG